MMTGARKSFISISTNLTLVKQEERYMCLHSFYICFLVLMCLLVSYTYATY